MNEYVKKFLHRGLIFGGFGPIIMGIVFTVLDATLEEFSVTGYQMLLAVVSTYLLAFLHAGASVFNQIESWQLPKSLACHFLTLYFAYVTTYAVNTWIAFEPIAILIFTGVFAAIYALVWLIVVISIKSTEKILNRKLK